ncbi:hypothetical protein COLO4_27730 [Corchorus olitorius]|uniref:Uncharacterized protein n=1 Tax=Corchorus olitorius TaxID=93759 RepID=A0A1R3HPG6_9ROSI|nr:hypothetical protein COLO4_27730 [Corchorus olitorius]
MEVAQPAPNSDGATGLDSSISCSDVITITSSSSQRAPENPFAQPEDDLKSNQKNSQTCLLDRIRQLELSKLLLPSSLSLVVALFTNQKSAGESPPYWLSLFLAVLLCIALVAMVYGLIYVETYPTVSRFVEPVGHASALLAFFTATFVVLPPCLYWLPLLCWLLIAAPYMIEVIDDYYRRQKVSVACVSQIMTGPTSNRSTSSMPKLHI